MSNEQRDTLVRVRSFNASVLKTEDGKVGVFQLVTPSGDYRRFVLTEAQVDQLAEMFVGLSCDLVIAR